MIRKKSIKVDNYVITLFFRYYNLGHLFIYLVDYVYGV